jgi:hypothetical protein
VQNQCETHMYTKYMCRHLYHEMWAVIWLVCFVSFCSESHEQFFSYLATVAITGDGAANLDICLALTAFSSEGSFTCNTYCYTGPPFLRSYPKDPWFYLLNTVLLAKEQSLSILNVLGLTRPARAGLELTTYQLLSESTTTRLRQPVYMISSWPDIYRSITLSYKYHITHVYRIHLDEIVISAWSAN